MIGACGWVGLRFLCLGFCLEKGEHSGNSEAAEEGSWPGSLVTFASGMALFVFYRNGHLSIPCQLFPMTTTLRERSPLPSHFPFPGSIHK